MIDVDGVGAVYTYVTATGTSLTFVVLEGYRVLRDEVGIDSVTVLILPSEGYYSYRPGQTKLIWRSNPTFREATPICPRLKATTAVQISSHG